MRELTLLENVFIAALLLFSLALPLLLSVCGPRDPAIKRSCMKTVWMGQALGALAAVAVLASARFAPYSTAFGLVSYVCCVLVLLRQFLVAGSA